MKKLLFTSLFLLSLAFAGLSQTIPPPYINYQKVLYDVNAANPNTPLTNQSFTTFVNINDELGNLLYEEEHYASTDANGLITVKMGDGLYIAGPITNFNLINWGVGKYYLVVDFNINGTISSTAPEQLVTVPYSFYAGKAGNGMTAVADNGNGTLTFTYANGQTYITPALAGMTGPVGPAGAQGIQGIPGANGAVGATGQNGLNALIKTTSEAAGANCTNGGTKIETGLDANGNGVLDGGEVNVSQTNYVCNGGGSNAGPAIHGSQIFLTDGFFVCQNSGIYNIVVWGASGGNGGNTSSQPLIGCASTMSGGIGGTGGYIELIFNAQSGDTLFFQVPSQATNGGSCNAGCVGSACCGTRSSGQNGAETKIGISSNLITNYSILVSGGTGGTGSYITCGCCGGAGVAGSNGSITYSPNFINQGFTTLSEGLAVCKFGFCPGPGRILIKW